MDDSYGDLLGLSASTHLKGGNILGRQRFEEVQVAPATFQYASAREEEL